MATYGVVTGRDKDRNYLTKEVHGKTLHTLLRSARAKLRDDQPVRITRMDRNGNARIYFQLNFDKDLMRLSGYARQDDAEAILLYDAKNSNPDATDVLMLASSENQLEAAVRDLGNSWKSQPDRILSTPQHIYWTRGRTSDHIGTESEYEVLRGATLCAPVEWLATRRQEGTSIRWGIDTDVAILCTRYLNQAGGLHLP